MDVPDYVEQLRRDGKRLATVASFTDPGAPVPTCPDWSLRDLVRHVGGVHRWATGFVRGVGRQPPDGDLERFVGGWPEDAEQVVWFADGHRVLAEALASAPADLETWTFLEAPTPLTFWARRQAHETAIHRVDAESAGGARLGEASVSTLYARYFAHSLVTISCGIFAGYPVIELGFNQPFDSRLVP